MKKLTGTEVLDLPMGQNDADAKTVRDYLKELVLAVVEDGESFSGKRPFGNSGWERELHWATVKAGAVRGTIDADGFLEDVDSKASFQLIFSAIRAL